MYEDTHLNGLEFADDSKVYEVDGERGEHGYTANLECTYIYLDDNEYSTVVRSRG